MQGDAYGPELFDEAAQAIFSMVNRDIYQRFLLSHEYQQMVRD